MIIRMKALSGGGEIHNIIHAGWYHGCLRKRVSKTKDSLCTFMANFDKT